MIHYLHYLPFKTYSFAVILSAVAAALSAAKGISVSGEPASSLRGGVTAIISKYLHGL